MNPRFPILLSHRSTNRFFPIYQLTTADLVHRTSSGTRQQLDEDNIIRCLSIVCKMKRFDKLSVIISFF